MEQTKPKTESKNPIKRLVQLVEKVAQNTNGKEEVFQFQLIKQVFFWPGIDKTGFLQLALMGSQPLIKRNASKKLDKEVV